MTLDRWIALALLLICAVYGYSAFFLVDAGLPPFMQRNPVKPSTFPKVLALMGMGLSLVILLGLEKDQRRPEDMDINYRRLTDYKLVQALILVGLMVAYAMLLRPLGFIGSTFLFLVISALVLGERRFVTLGAVSAIAAFGVWYLVQEVLGIFLRPWPMGI
ncbi:MAG: tripartite tricarboxylate transporter TctB family protein [Pseudomonadota bacterium]